MIIAVESGDYAAAVKAADRIEIPAGWLPSRVGHLHLDLARAHLWMGNPDGAMAELLKARDIAPQQAGHHPLAQAAIDALLRLPRPKETTRTYAAWMAAHG